MTELDSRPADRQAGPTNQLTSLETAIMHTVAYVDVFDYPLTAGELHRYLVGVATTPAELATALGDGRLIPRRLSQVDGYYTLPGREAIVATRRRRTAAANRLWPVALRYGRTIASLPFVRMVAVTGSLAVNNIDAAADIDYLIVTENGRLWLARALTILLVRLAARRGFELCPNYFLAERALAFDDRNLYTAREIAQMVPIAGFATYERLRQSNSWTAEFLPNAAGTPEPPAVDGFPRSTRRTSARPWRRLAEALLRTRAGAGLERWEMNRKIRKFSRAAANDHSDWYGQGHAEAAFCPDWCKGHFHDHAQRILESYDQTLGRLSKS